MQREMQAKLNPFQGADIWSEIPLLMDQDYTILMPFLYNYFSSVDLQIKKGFQAGITESLPYLILPFVHFKSFFLTRKLNKLHNLTLSLSCFPGQATQKRYIFLLLKVNKPYLEAVAALCSQRQRT